MLSSLCLYGNFEEALDVGLDVYGLEGAAVASERLPLWPDEELLEVPGHIGAAHWAPNDELGIGHERKRVIVGVGELVLQVGEDRMLVLTIHLTLLGQGKGGLEPTPRADVLETVQDLLILTVLLGKEEDREHGKGEAKGRLHKANLSPSRLLPRIILFYVTLPSLFLFFPSSFALPYPCLRVFPLTATMFP